MAEIPILFKGPMMRAILEGNKTMTRRVLSPQPAAISAEGRWYKMPNGGQSLNCFDLPYQVGDRLWTRERFAFGKGYDDLNPLKVPHPTAHIHYFADGPTSSVPWEVGRPRASIHQPKCWSRLTLQVTDVRVEYLQDISADDALAEGVEESYEIVAIHGTPRGPSEEMGTRYRVPGLHDDDEDFEDPIEVFLDLWNSLNEELGFGWDVNPIVAAVTFKIAKDNEL